ncbi:hypothetical protein ACWOFR_18345 [Carnobacterium gallinarum]|uniref:hypothetical protein n=1 Tax=Carnobacterium gallinarum TaxID=2749 RepID=UPI0005514ED1|nr:hypothetical protein [Carnobacterium gallinarum]
MNIQLLEEEIEKTEYWDMTILDVQIKYFGDEVDIFIEDDDKTCWKISFISCYKVGYETDVNWRMIRNVKDMKWKQLGYYGQDISLKKYEENENFVHCSLDLSIMSMEIICKDISVEKIGMEDVSFFWEEK